MLHVLCAGRSLGFNHIYKNWHKIKNVCPLEISSSEALSNYLICYFNNMFTRRFLPENYIVYVGNTLDIPKQHHTYAWFKYLVFCEKANIQQCVTDQENDIQPSLHSKTSTKMCVYEEVDDFIYSTS